MKQVALILCFGAFAFAASPCDALKQLKGETATTSPQKKGLGQKLRDRLVCAAELEQIELAKRQARAAASGQTQTNHNGGRAKYAMDGISVGDGYYLDRSGTSATR